MVMPRRRESWMEVSIFVCWYWDTQQGSELLIESHPEGAGNMTPLAAARLDDLLTSNYKSKS